jgi:hypothetical protein
MGRGGVSGKAVLGRGLHGELAAIYLRERAASRHSHGGGQRGIRQSAAALLERDSRETCRMQWSTVDGRWPMVNGQWSKDDLSECLPSEGAVQRRGAIVGALKRRW